MSGDLRGAIDRAKARLVYAERAVEHERLFGVASGSRARALETEVTRAERDLEHAQAKLDRAMPR